MKDKNINQVHTVVKSDIVAELMSRAFMYKTQTGNPLKLHIELIDTKRNSPEYGNMAQVSILCDGEGDKTALKALLVGVLAQVPEMKSLIDEALEIVNNLESGAITTIDEINLN